MTKDVAIPQEGGTFRTTMKEYLCGYFGDLNSATATTSSVYLRIPFRCILLKAFITTYGAPTGTDIVVTLALNGTTLTNNSTITCTASDAAAGNSYTAAGALDQQVRVFANYGDTFSFVSNHAGTGACPATATLEVLAV